MNPPVRISGGRGGKVGVGTVVGRGCGGDGGQGMGWSDGSRQTKREMLQRKTKRRSHKGRGRNSCTATVIDVQALIKGAAVFMVLKRVRWSHGGRENSRATIRDAGVLIKARSFGPGTGGFGPNPHGLSRRESNPGTHIIVCSFKPHVRCNPSYSTLSPHPHRSTERGLQCCGRDPVARL